MLATKIIKGGSGAWGAVPMPANPQVSDAEAKARGPNVVSEAGIVSEVIGDESNASLPMLMTELPSVSDVRDAPQKAQSPMAVTKLGIVSEVSGTE
jgi:hypothetical protein